MTCVHRLCLVLCVLFALGLGINPSWSACPSAALEPRFKLSRTGDMAYDRAIRAIWMRCSYGQNWSSPGGQCLGQPYRATGQEVSDLLVKARSKGWVLPTKAQMGTLYDHDCGLPSTNSAAFPASPDGVFWTAEALSLWSAGQPPGGSLVVFSAGGAGTSGRASGNAFYVRLVLLPGSQEAKAAGIPAP